MFELSDQLFSPLRCESFSFQLHSNVEPLTKQLQSFSTLLSNERQLLEKAPNVVKESNRVLQYSHVFAFYLDESNAQMILEDNQRDLEEKVTALTCLIGRNVQDNPFLSTEECGQFKSQIFNITKLVGPPFEFFVS